MLKLFSVRRVDLFFLQLYIGIWKTMNLTPFSIRWTCLLIIRKYTVLQNGMKRWFKTHSGAVQVFTCPGDRVHALKTMHFQ